MIVCLLALVHSLSLGFLALAGVGAVAALLVYEHSLVHAHDLSRVDAAFFTMNGWVSVLFFIFWAAIFSCVIRVFDHMQVLFEDPRLTPVRQKVEAGERLSFEDGVTLYRTHDILAVGYLANLVRERLHGNTPISTSTAISIHRCLRSQLPPLRLRQARARSQSLHHVARRGLAARGRRLHRSGHRVPHRGWPASRADLDWYCEMLRGLKERFPLVHLKAFTMVEIAYLARRANIGVRETLERLRDAGMDSLPGGGAEIFAPAVRRIICDHKIDGDDWIETARRPPARPALQLHHALRPH